VEPLLEVFSRLAETIGVQPKLYVQGYDDSLRLPRIDVSPRACFIFLDLARYESLTERHLHAWILERGSAVSTHLGCPVFVVQARGIRSTEAEFGDEMPSPVWPAVDSASDVYVCDVTSIFGPAAYESSALRREFTGSPLSQAASAGIARLLATRGIASLVLPPIKAIIVDLDQTLYSDVLGESGEQLLITSADQDATTFLNQAIDHGILVSVASHNDPRDIQLLLNRTDFNLSWSELWRPQLSWDPKSEQVARILEGTSISPESVLFVDDNVANIMEVRRAFPGIRAIHVIPSRELRLAHSLMHFPGMTLLGHGSTATVRRRDLEAQVRRQALREAALSEEDYLVELETTLLVRHATADDTDRIVELSQRTNQFNVAMSRFTRSDVARRMRDSQASFWVAEVEDKFTSLGTVAFMYVAFSGTSVHVLDYCMSCRALGRGLETLFLRLVIDSTLRSATDAPRTGVALSIRSVEGPRNEPARKWFAALANPQTQLEISSEELAQHLHIRAKTANL
jgi:FkbH-like protein